MLCADTVERPDALFADIRLDGASDVAGGIELVRSRFPRGCGTQVVYVTGYAEYCTPVYETEHVYFLTKPVRQAELDNALRAVLANLDERRTAAIPVQTGGRLIGLVPGRVRYLESDRRKVLVSLTKKGRQVLRAHNLFHHQMIDEALADLSEEEERVFAEALSKVKAFFDAQA